jgi:Ca2+-dependent lipid-binding protein
VEGGEKYLTAVQSKNLNPVWNEEFLFGVDGSYNSLYCKIMDYDEGALDEPDFIGQVG